MIQARKVARLDSAAHACGPKKTQQSIVDQVSNMLAPDNPNGLLQTKVLDAMEELFQEPLMQDLGHVFQDTPKLEHDGLPQLDPVTSIETNDMPIEEMFDLD